MEYTKARIPTKTVKGYSKLAHIISGNEKPAIL